MAAPFLIKRVARSAVQESESGEGTSQEHLVQTWRQRPNASGDDRFEERDHRALGSNKGAHRPSASSATCQLCRFQRLTTLLGLIRRVASYRLLCPLNCRSATGKSKRSDQVAPLPLGLLATYTARLVSGVLITAQRWALAFAVHGCSGSTSRK